MLYSPSLDEFKFKKNFEKYDSLLCSVYLIEAPLSPFIAPFTQNAISSTQPHSKKCSNLRPIL